MKKLKRVYLGRRECCGRYELATTKKSWCPWLGFDGIDTLEAFCTKDFERVTGIKLGPGEVRRVNINIEILD